MEDRKYDIFISYSSVDQERAFDLCTAFELQGLICWIAPRNVGVGAYANSIVDGIKNSKALVLLFSSHSNKSTPVLNEIEIATNNKLTIIPVRIEDVFPTGSMEYYVMSSNWFDVLHPSSVEDFQDFANTIKSTIHSIDTIVTQKLTTSTINKSKKISLKSFTFVLLFFTFILSLFTVNSMATNTIQKKTIEQKNILIEQQNRLLELYLKEKERNKNNSMVISHAEDIKNIAGYAEAIRYFRSKNKELFYTNYKNIKIYYNKNSNLFIVNIETKKTNRYIIKITNIEEEYKDNIYLEKGFYNIEISSNGYINKRFIIKIDKDSNVTIRLKSKEEALNEREEI